MRQCKVQGSHLLRETQRRAHGRRTGAQQPEDNGGRTRGILRANRSKDFSLSMTISQLSHLKRPQGANRRCSSANRGFRRIYVADSGALLTPLRWYLEFRFYIRNFFRLSLYFYNSNS